MILNMFCKMIYIMLLNYITKRLIFGKMGNKSSDTNLFQGEGVDWVTRYTSSKNYSGSYGWIEVKTWKTRVRTYARPCVRQSLQFFGRLLVWKICVPKRTQNITVNRTQHFLPWLISVFLTTILNNDFTHGSAIFNYFLVWYYFAETSKQSSLSLS